MSSSAWTQFKYKNETGRSLIKDLSKIADKYNEIKDKDEIEQFSELEDFIDLVLRVAYIMSLEGKSITGSYEDFLMQIDSYMDNLDWFGEVMELAISPLQRNV